MRTLFFGALGALVLASHSFAAPVPKESPEAALKRIYGERVCDKSCVECEAGDRGSLIATVPEGLVRDGDAARQDVLYRLEVSGDFRVTMQAKLEFDPDKVTEDHEKRSFAYAGVAVVSPDKRRSAHVELEYHKRGKTWRDEFGMGYTDLNTGMGGGGGDPGLTWKSRYLRLTRTGRQLEMEWSWDKKKWNREYVEKNFSLDETAYVGPIVHCSGGTTLKATFNDYELTLLPDGKKEEVKK